MCWEALDVCELVVHFFLWSGDLIRLFSVVVFGITVVFSGIRARVVLPCRRLLASFVDLAYEARVVSVRSVDWGLSVGVSVVGGRDVRRVRGGAFGIFVFLESLLHFWLAS